jgi:hypothetical protein
MNVQPMASHFLGLLDLFGQTMRAFLNIAVVLICVGNYVSAQPLSTVLWRAERVHYAFPDTKPYWAWIILPAEEGITNRGAFKTTVDSIFRSEPAALIQHVCLGSVYRDPAMQKEVMDRLKDTVMLRKYPTRHSASGRMYIDGTTNSLDVEMCRLVKAAILKTALVRHMNDALTPYGLHIGDVSTEKLCIFSESGAYHWEGITSLIIKRVEPDGASNGSRSIRSETNQTSSAAGSHR